MARRGDVLHNAVTGHSYTIVACAADTDGALLTMDATFPPASVRPPSHVHPLQAEHFTVLEGSLNVVLAGEQRHVRAGESFDVPAGVPHAMWNGGEAPARAQWETRPALHTEQFFETVVALAAQGRVRASGVPHPLDLGLLMRRFDREMRVVSPPRPVQHLIFGVLAFVGWMTGRRLP